MKRNWNTVIMTLIIIDTISVLMFRSAISIPNATHKPSTKEWKKKGRKTFLTFYDVLGLALKNMVLSSGQAISILALKVFVTNLPLGLIWDWPVFPGGQPILADFMEEIPATKNSGKYLRDGSSMAPSVPSCDYTEVGLPTLLQ